MPPDASVRPSAVPWPPILFLAALAGGIVLRRVYPLAWPGLDDAPARAVGYAFGLAGVALTAWGMLTLFRAKTNILPHKGADRLITEGAFAFRRNPIYMGETLVFLGLAQATANIWLAIMAPVFALAILALAILPEERHLEARFGADYEDYKARTRRWF
jgi:protein-S-isoprenylcysteine O-methyltransferase Ste14